MYAEIIEKEMYEEIIQKFQKMAAKYIKELEKIDKLSKEIDKIEDEDLGGGKSTGKIKLVKNKCAKKYP